MTTPVDPAAGSWTPRELESVAVGVAVLAAELVRAEAGGSAVAGTKSSPTDVVTETDLAAEKLIRRELEQRCPGSSIVGEELAETNGSNGVGWIVDPIDGTVNYVHGNPLCGVSLALVEDDTPAVGVIDLPRLGDRYWAAPTFGAFRNHKHVAVSSADRVAEAVVSLGDFAVGADAAGRNRVRLDVVAALADEALRLRMIGSAAADLAWVTDGKLDGTIVIGGHLWDLAAGIALVREAGGLVVQRTLDGSDVSIAGTPPVTAGLLEIVDRIDMARPA